MARTPGVYHRLAFALCLVYIASACLTLLVYGFRMRVLGGLQFTGLVAATITTLLLVRLIPYTTNVDAKGPLSRVGKHFVFIGVAMFLWLFSALGSIIQLFDKTTEIEYDQIRAQCAADRFLTFFCVPIGVNLVLPVIIFATLVRASWTVFHRATAIHGEDSIPLPHGIPHPANFWPFKAYPPGYEVPRWMLAHIADTERDDEEESAKNSVELV
ncbi:hypothetical protein DFH06DRAFT_1320145 [Mycena polygramma]|nr:hypothetical protein DFH06DRAFT_1320145 [Mycena polygramma]